MSGLSDEAMERAEQLGAFVHVDRHIEVDGVDVEIVKTFADSLGTIVLYRAPRRSRIFMSPLEPPEIVHGSSGGGGGDLLHSEFEPVLPERTSITVSFGRLGDDPFQRGDLRVELPVDRTRTAPFDRSLQEPAPDLIVTDGASIKLIDLVVGLRGGVATVNIEKIDPSILYLDLGWPDFFGRHFGPRSGPGDPALWTEWVPEPSPDTAVKQVVRKMPDGTMMVTASMSLGTLVARKLRPGERPPGPPREEPPPPLPLAVQVFSLPEREPLSDQRMRGIGMGQKIREATTKVSFFTPPSDSEGVELLIQGLYVARFAGGSILMLPRPSLDQPVSLEGFAFDSPDGLIELQRWEPNHGSYSLVLRLPSHDWSPDLRVMYETSSVTLWAHRGPKGTVVAGLPGRHNDAFERPDGARIGLRAISKPAPPVRLSARLTPSSS